MLNISKNSIRQKVDTVRYGSMKVLEDGKTRRWPLYFLCGFFGILLIILFLPWTQNIQGQGFVTTLKPEHRPQTVNALIAGKIEKWYVREGEFVNRGDTIIHISEIKDKYLDPMLVDRTAEQLKAKELNLESYSEKVEAIDNQITAMEEVRQLKVKQAANKLQQALLSVQSDSMDYEAAKTNFNIAEVQFQRMEQMYEQGLKSLTEYEGRKLKYQEARAKMIAAENQLLSSRNEVLNRRMELASIQSEFRDKISKAKSEKYAAMSSLYDSRAALTKMQNELVNYSLRSGMYFITAPQSGYITKAIRSGIGETVKEGSQIVSIMPAGYDLAVESYVRPMDLPLISPGQEVLLQFDGWPAIVFSGWPTLSHGTYEGEVVAIDNFVSENGKYRILIAEQPESYDWPDALRLGAGARTMAMLKDVPVWYELWRRFNGFPPDFYQTPVKKNKNEVLQQEADTAE